jgi:hypothetical protein
MSVYLIFYSSPTILVYTHLLPLILEFFNTFCLTSPPSVVSAFCLTSPPRVMSAFCLTSPPSVVYAFCLTSPPSHGVWCLQEKFEHTKEVNISRKLKNRLITTKRKGTKGDTITCIYKTLNKNLICPIFTILHWQSSTIYIYICLKIKPNSVRIRFLSCQIFVLPPTGFELTPLIHCSTIPLALRPAP